MQEPTQGAETPTLASEKVYDYLENEILVGTLPGGSRLRVRQLAERVGTSMIPVRDAISRLEATGLAERVPYQGAVVKEFSTRELIEIYNVRTLLEQKAAYDGTLRASEEDLAKMRVASKKSSLAANEGKLVEAMSLDTEMIRVLYRVAGNTVMLNMIESLWKQCHLYRLIAFRNAYEHQDTSMRDAQLIVLDAALAHDPVAAQDATRRSLELAKRAIALRRP